MFVATLDPDTARLWRVAAGLGDRYTLDSRQLGQLRTMVAGVLAINKHGLPGDSTHENTPLYIRRSEAIALGYTEALITELELTQEYHVAEFYRDSAAGWVAGYATRLYLSDYGPEIIREYASWDFYTRMASRS